MLECAMQSEIIQQLHSNNNLYCEVPFLSRVIDLLKINSSNELYVYELKINDWKHAIKQMQCHRCASDYNILVMPRTKVRKSRFENMKVELTKYGFGLSVWDSHSKKLESLLSPKKNQFKDPYLFSNLLKIARNHQCQKKLNITSDSEVIMKQKYLPIKM